MFHVKEDKRSQNSANLLMDGLVECLSHKDFTKITITDLQKASGVSRATFYRLFDTIEDVLAYKCERLAQNLKENYPKTEKDPNKFLLYIIRYWFENYMYIEAIYKCNRPDILQQALIKQTENDDFDIDNEKSRIKKEYISASIIGSLSSTLMCWIKNGRKETPEELYDIFYEYGQFMARLKNESET